MQDRSLQNVAAVILDEFHERSIDADLALTLCTDCQKRLRPDLRSAIGKFLPFRQLYFISEIAPLQYVSH